MRTGLKFNGVARYSSLNSHMGIEKSRRDDLEAIGNILIYLIKGSLPWQKIKVMPGETIERAIYRRKLETSIHELCSGLPNEFKEYMKYCRKLEFSENPDYDYLMTLFENLQLK